MSQAQLFAHLIQQTRLGIHAESPASIVDALMGRWSIRSKDLRMYPSAHAADLRQFITAMMWPTYFHAQRFLRSRIKTILTGRQIENPYEHSVTSRDFNRGLLAP